MDKTKQLHAIVVGDRDYPHSPLLKIEAEEFGPTLAQMQESLPDLNYADLLRFVVRAGLAQVAKVYASAGRIERGGVVVFAPDPKYPRPAQEAAYAKLLRPGSGVLAKAPQKDGPEPKKVKEEPEPKAGPGAVCETCGENYPNHKPGCKGEHVEPVK